MLTEPDTRPAAVVRAVVPNEDVVADLSYVVPGALIPVSYAFEPPAGVPWESAAFRSVPARIADARTSGALPGLHANGFELVDAPTAVRDFEDPGEVEAVYGPEVLELALSVTGGACGFVFDHLVRKRDPNQPTPGFGRTAGGGPPSANGRVHNDYTETSGRRRLRLVLGEGERSAAIARYCIVNVWRPIAHRVLDAPLALCDSRTVAASDAVVAEVRYPARSGEIYLFRHSAQHRWYYYPAMERSEAVVFKQYDSRLGGVSRFTPHCAFDHPLVPEGSPPRQSIEARVLVVFD